MTELQELKEKAEKAFEQIENYKEFKKKFGSVKNEMDIILAKIKSLEALEKEKTISSKRWKPKQGEIYCMISTYGDILSSTWNNTRADWTLYNMGNCFPTKEAAEFEVERLKVLAEMREFAYEPDWGNKDERRYTIYYSTSKDILLDYWYYAHFSAPIIFKSEEKAKACIDAIGKERLKKYYFKVAEK